MPGDQTAISAQGFEEAARSPGNARTWAASVIGFIVGMIVANAMTIALWCSRKATFRDRLIMFFIGLCGLALSLLSAMRAPG